MSAEREAEAEVIIAQDNLAKNQWGRKLLFIDFFYKLSGNKKVLDIKHTGIGIVVACVIFIVFQGVFDSSSTGSKQSSISEVSPTSSETIEVPAFMAQQGVSAPVHTTQAVPGKLSGPQVFIRPKDLRSIPPGTLLSAVLRTGGSNGPVKAEGLEALRVNGETLVEKGATFVGNGSSGDERLMVSFNQVVFKDGSFGQINATACDNSDKIVGLKGSKLGHKALNIAGSIGLGFLGGFSEALQDSKGHQGSTVRAPSMKNALLNGTATAALEQSKNLMSEVKDQPNIIEISQQTPICILFGEVR